MSTGARERERIRWRCRRGMLELDLVLNAYTERHLEGLDLGGLETLNGILARTDPELLDLIMGRSEGRNPAERAMLEVMRDASCNECSTRPV
jgi:antitoxin CptB